METLGLAADVSLWLLSAREARSAIFEGAGEARAPSERYRQAAAAQKIYFEPGSITQDLLLEAAFEARGVSAPSVEDARALFGEIEASVPLYRFEVEGQIWRVRNGSEPAFSDPLVTDRWELFARTSDSATRRIEIDGADVSDAFAWLPLLDGHHPPKEVRDAAARCPASLRVFAMLEEIGALILDEEEAFRVDALPELLFMSHSSVLVRGREASVLIDPAFLPTTEYLSAPGRRPFEIASHASAVLVSHHHWDHLSFQTMLRVPRDTKMIVPRARRPTLSNPPLAAYLRAFGFCDVVEVGDWDELRIGDIEVTFAPFFGEPFGLDSRFDAFTYVVRSGGTTIYGSLDACHDEAGSMDSVMPKIADEHDVDVFLFGASAQRHDRIYRAANLRHYSNELAFCPEMVRYHPDVDDVARWCEVLRPKVIIPYACFVYFGDESEDVRFGAKSNFVRHWSAVDAAVQELAPPHKRWRADLERLSAGVDAALLMLHPMQGARA
jgi:L-ascorbate metabolism protein UlaG (beta-lactamase superfamily)